MIEQAEPMGRLQSCHHCGLVQRLPGEQPPGLRTVCARCECTMRGRPVPGSGNDAAAAFALAALILYPLAVTLPLISIEQLGHTQAASVLEGVTALLSSGNLLAGLVVLLCSVVLPLLKLLALLALSTGRGLGERHRVLTYRMVDWAGRWGMLDVLLVAILIAVLKLGDLMTVRVGPGLLAFTTCVTLSLVAATVFDPHRTWEPQS
jgi:paraquat-inducible protein A